MSKSFPGAALSLVVAAALSAPAANAASIYYSLTSLGGDAWRYSYALDNSTAPVDFDEVTVYFDLPATASITSFTAPAGWDTLTIQPDSSVPASGFVDAVHAGGHIPTGAVINGFSVDFLAAPGTQPASQSFDLVASTPFQVVYSGATTLAPVPEPGSAALMMSGVVALAFLLRRRMNVQGAE
jgi:hypothetical protein